MGNSNTKRAVEDDKSLDELSKSGSHFTRKELSVIKKEFEALADKNKTITKENFNKILAKHVQFWTGGTLFFERLFDAFDTDGNKTIDINEFIRGLSTFMKGTAEEKLELTFKFYDINRDGTVSQKEIAKILSNLYSSFYNEDQSAKIQEMSRRWFEDLDVNGDGSLSFEEFKLSALKEPMVVNFLEQFLLEKSVIE